MPAYNKKYSIILAFVLLLAASGGVVFSEQGNNTTQEQDKTKYEWDFGKVKAGQKLEHTFSYKNETGKLLTIKDLDTSCGCTASTISSTKRRPGEYAQIKVSFNSSSYRGKTQQTVYMHTDNAELAVVRFIISAEVIAK